MSSGSRLLKAVKANEAKNLRLRTDARVAYYKKRERIRDQSYTGTAVHPTNNHEGNKATEKLVLTTFLQTPLLQTQVILLLLLIFLVVLNVQVALVLVQGSTTDR